MSKKTSKQHDDKSVTVCNEETNHQPKNQRRALIASIAAAGAVGLPTQWKKPVIDHILLPAHAQMSPDPSSTFTTQVTTSFSVAQSASGLFTCSIDILRAQAIISTTFLSGTYSITYTGTDILQQSCVDPVGGFTSSSSSFSFGLTSTATVLPTISSFTTLIPSGTGNITGTYTSSASISGTTTVTSSA